MLATVLMMMTIPTSIGADKTPAEKYKNHAPIEIYPEGNIPYLAEGETITPAIRPYIEDNNPDGRAMIVFPGGGYNHHFSGEGANIAKLYNSAGNTSFVVDYRLGTLGQANGITPRPEPTNDYHAILSDGIRAVKYVRANAEEFGIDPDKIAVIGFSAGGHLCTMLSTHFDFAIDAPEYVPDVIDEVSARPDATVLSYPVVTLLEPYTHDYTAKAFTHGDKELAQRFSGELSVTDKTSPIFMWHRRTDPTAPPQNSIQLALALQENNIPYELHVFAKGNYGHGGAINSYDEIETDPSGKWFELSLAFLDGVLTEE